MFQITRRRSARLATCIGLSLLVLASSWRTAVVAQATPPIAEFQIPTANSYPYGITAGPDGNIWFTESSFTEPNGSIIGRITPNGTITEFPLPNKFNSNPFPITVGPDGNLWFAELPPKIGRMTPTGAVTEFLIPSGASANGIVGGPDGNVWFTETNANRIGRITPAGVVAEFVVPTVRTSPWRITAGPDGNLWFTELTWNAIGRITPAGAITEFPLPNSIYGDSITAGPDGNVWFTTYGSTFIGRITPTGGVTLFPISTEGFGIAAGPDGNLWFTENLTNKIGRITPAGAVDEFLVPTANSRPYGITAGPDGNLWFTEHFADKIGRITFRAPSPGGPPDPPTNLAATATGSTIVLTWNGPSFGGPATSYVIEAGTVRGAANLAVIDTGNSSTTFSASGVPPGNYFLRVRAKNGIGSSATSNEASLVVGTWPGMPRNFAAQVTGATVYLTWDTPLSGGPVTSYVIEAGTSIGASNLVTLDTGNASTALLANGVPGGIYFVRVRARNGFGSSAPSHEIGFVIGGGPCIPGAPTGLSALVNSNNVTLAWSAPAGPVTTYVVEAGSMPGASNIASIETGNASTSLTAVAPPGTYFIRVRARNACGTSGPSNEASATVF